jgi:hypothetical protein
MAGIFGLLMSGAGVIKDQYFNLTSLLLPGNGTNGAQNNTFLDSGTANSGSGFTITRNGNTTQGTFSPFSQTGWGNYFNGSSYLTSSHPALNATFTIEAWIYRTSGSALQSIIFLNAGGNSGVIVYIDASNYLTVTDGSTGQSAFSNLTVPINSWTHIAVVRSGGTTTGYVNGTVAGSHTFTPSTVNAATIARYSAASPLYFPGYVSNVRVVNGTAVYTGAFTPSTVPLTAITNTSLLTCQSNRFIDNSSSPLTITANGSPSVTPFAPFATTQSYSASAVGGSGYFDGTGDYLSIADNAAFSYGTGDFTVEFWMYPTTTGATKRLYFHQTTSTTQFSITQLTANTINVFANNSSTTIIDITGSTAVSANTWTHVAVVRSGNTFTLYQNGTSVGSGTSSASMPDPTGSLYIGALDTGSDPYTGYLSSYRIVKGTAITPPSGGPTAPLTAVSGTSLLLNFTNAGVVDATAKNVLETVGNAQISTSVSKFGGGSISFDGTSNTGIKAPAGNLFTFGSGAFTVEFWVRFNSVAADQAVLNVTGTTNVLTFYVLSTGSLNYYLSSNGSSYDIASGVSVGSISTGQWYRVALVRSGNTFTPYLNTTAGTTSTSSSALATPSSGTFLHLGMSVAGTSNFNGYIDDVRVTRGVARDMTVLPTAPFPVQ